VPSACLAKAPKAELFRDLPRDPPFGPDAIDLGAAQRARRQRSEIAGPVNAKAACSAEDERIALPDNGALPRGIA
jgi:hypothetical protein